MLAVPKLNSVTLHYFENCVGCAACAPSCPYFYVDERYSPVEKAEFLREMLRARYTLSGRLFGRLVGARMPKSEDEMWKILEFAYRCTNCGHCYVTCPFGIDSGAMVRLLKQTLYSAGVAPTLMKQFAGFEGSGQYLQHPSVKGVWDAFMAEAAKLGAPVDKKGARVLLMVSFMDVVLMRDTVLNTIKILKRVGEDFTIPSRPLGVRPPIGAVVGDPAAQRAAVEDVVKYAESISPQILVTIDGGFVYPNLRFEATNLLRRKFSFKVYHVTELLAEYLREGKLKLKKTGAKVTWHDPCQLGRRAGVFEEPREVLEAFTDYRDLPHNRANSLCCGGGDGINCLTKEMHMAMGKLLGMDIWGMLSAREKEFVEKSEDAYKKAIRRKMDDVRKSGAEVVVTACPVGIETIRLGTQLYGVNAKVVHIVDLVAEALE
ncbi:(Fe-S)-binding protein [Pyrobaculum neutrophilum]|uniref:4Fe-4S ferredoxin, iron-sulfur binding domain protein n=1 Tax=Pyrobaculum neutrophilum (strain DSM 2338 / JCM 9278 / NBRC 100436 / V24Sta) TaxID=444157 RepID=B1YBX0_PYRNV|nr:(Fe-S)-binding protein [Pyrobaculum neutrophilum]ACB39354.1 4Fe-4S ferredoxin, iron-sulfur binding domain protein [Pyrobaculum neutrophilum V24Sta]